MQAPLRYGVPAAALGVAALGALMLIQRGLHPALGIAVAAGMLYAACVLLLRIALQRARHSAASLKAQFASQEAECAELERRVPDSREITGNLAMPGFTAPKLLWVRRHEPDCFEQVAVLRHHYCRIESVVPCVVEKVDCQVNV